MGLLCRSVEWIAPAEESEAGELPVGVLVMGHQLWRPPTTKGFLALALALVVVVAAAAGRAAPSATSGRCGCR